MKSFFAVATVCMLILSGAVQADVSQPRNCRLIMEVATGKVIVREGPCEVRWTPCSTFKVPLAVMGFDSGVLKNEHEPAWDYLTEYHSWRTDDQRTIDPTSWESISVVWYSQKLTRTLGEAAFQKYVKQFQYGNQDVSGDAGKNNGLTESWLISSLKISPDEQVAFLEKFFKRQLDVSDHAYEKTANVLPKFEAEDGWVLTGKTGSGFQRKADGTLDRKKHVGWFVGWATKGERRLIFAELQIDETPHDDYGGPRSRAAMIEALPKILKKDVSAPK